MAAGAAVAAAVGATAVSAAVVPATVAGCAAVVARTRGGALAPYPPPSRNPSENRPLLAARYRGSVVVRRRVGGVDEFVVRVRMPLWPRPRAPI